MAAYRTIANPVYTNLHFIQIWQPASQHIFTILNYVHTYVPFYIFKVFSLHNILNNNTCSMSGEILLCSNVLRTCTWKIVFKIENNELNELSECMFYKMFAFPENISKMYNSLLQLFFKSLACF